MDTRTALVLLLIAFGFNCIVAFQKIAVDDLASNKIDEHFEFNHIQDDTLEHHKGPFRHMFSYGDMNIAPSDTVDPGKPLFLTPMIKAGKIDEARSMSRVALGHRYGHSFSGFFTVNEKYDSNMFFWFCPARSNATNSPLVIWLQGGPGGSSLFGLFEENGPFIVNKDMNLEHRKYSWNNNHNMLYFDNPVGTGFSFTKDDKGYARNQADVGRDLYAALAQFYTLFPSFQKADLYITGESYAGKYVPALAYTIHKMNSKAVTKMNLKGMAIGDGLCDPITMTDYGDFLYQIGLIDAIERVFFKRKADDVVKFIKQKEWKKAFEVFDSLLNGDKLKSSTSYFYNVTGLKNYYNFLLQDIPKRLSYYQDYVNLGKIRREIHVGNLTFNDGKKVEDFLEEDIMKSVKPWIEEIMNNYKVLFYNGQLDIIIAYTLTENFINTLNWKHADEFKKSDRYIWRNEGDVAGYVREVTDFAQVMVRNAGHMVPFDQPKWAYDMMTRFTQGRNMH